MHVLRASFLSCIAVTATGMLVISSPAAAIPHASTPPFTQESAVRVTFDGRTVDATNVGSLVPAPVVAFGPTRDDDGDAIPGEMWLLVSKPEKLVYYHLTDAAASGSASYAGFEVVARAIVMQEVANYGTGEHVPVVGNSDDAYVMTTFDLAISSRLVGAPMICQGGAGSSCTPSAFLIDVGSITHVAQVPTSTSGLACGALAVFDGAGALLEDVTECSIPSGSSTGDPCVALGDRVGAAAQNVLDASHHAGGVLSDGVLTMVGAAAGAVAGGAAGGGVVIGGVAGFLGGGMAGAVGGLEVSERLVRPIQDAVKSGVDSFAAPLADQAATAACIAGETGLDLIAGLELGEVEVQTATVTCGGQSVCTATGTQQTGSVATSGTTTDESGNSIEEVVVSPVVEDVCTDSTVVFTCHEV